jgi:hydrogenase maturation protease
MPGCRSLPAHVETLDVGIGGMHFVLRLLDGFQNIVVVDAFTGGQPPGTLYVFALDATVLQGRSTEPIDPHLTEPLRAMQLGKQLGVLPETVTMVGCEPQTCELGMGLTAAVQAAVDSAVEKIREIIGSHGARD